MQGPTYVRSDPRFKNLGSGCKSLESCADVVSDVDIEAKSRLLRLTNSCSQVLIPGV